MAGNRELLKAQGRTRPVGRLPRRTEGSSLVSVRPGNRVRHFSGDAGRDRQNDRSRVHHRIESRAVEHAPVAATQHSWSVIGQRLSDTVTCASLMALLGRRRSLFKATTSVLKLPARLFGRPTWVGMGSFVVLGTPPFQCLPSHIRIMFGSGQATTPKPTSDSDRLSVMRSTPPPPCLPSVVSRSVVRWM